MNCELSIMNYHIHQTKKLFDEQITEEHISI